MKKTLKFMLCGATVMLFAACGGAASDGEKLAELTYAVETAKTPEEAKKATEELTEFAKKMEETYKDDTAAQKELKEACAKKLEELRKGGEQK